MILLLFITIVFFILLEAFFSGSEMAVISVNRIKMEQLAQSKVSQAVLLKKMLAHPDRLLSTTLVGTNLSAVISSAIFTMLIVTTFGEGYAWLTPVIMTPIILIFGEAIPKITFRHYADLIVFHIVKILQFFSLLFWPIILLTSAVTRTLLWPLGIKEKARKSLFVTREELKLLIKESKKDVEIKPYERSIIHRIFEFGSKKVKEIMVPLDNIVSVEANEDLARLKELSKTSGFSRILVYAENKQNIIGFANVFDAFYAPEKLAKVLDCLRPLFYISQESPIDKVFYSLQLKRMQVAILIDENKRHVGMVTFENLFDEIIGEI